jgi:hypothetical protein
MDADADKVGRKLVTSRDAALLLKVLELEEWTNEESHEVESDDEVAQAARTLILLQSEELGAVKGFQYSPLETPTMIRLAELPINTSNDFAQDAKPELVLRHYELASNRQKYRALSYA